MRPVSVGRTRTALALDKSASRVTSSFRASAESVSVMLAADTEENFVSSVRALDRVLLSGDYVVPLFYTPRQWVAYWARLKHPEKTPLFGYAVDTWWAESK